MSTNTPVENQTPASTATVDFDLVVYRFSNDVPAMARFVDAVGLRRTIESEGGGFVTFAGAGGGLALHSVSGSNAGARDGDTQLSFDVDDIDAASEGLNKAGLDPRHWDESYGRAMAIKDPAGYGLWINESQADTYGYRSVGSSPRPDDPAVIAVRPSMDFAADTSFYGVLGYQPESVDATGYRQLQACGESGIIGLHDPGQDFDMTTYDAGPPIGYPVTCRLGFATSERLTDLAGRLQSAGYSDAVAMPNVAAPRVEVTDPDGHRIEIHVKN